MKVELVILAIILHFIFDWILQPRDLAKKKGRTNDGINAVLIHMLINIMPFSFVLAGILYYYGFDVHSILGILFLNGASHFLIDVLLPKGNTERQMINWTALDQILHLTILIGLLNLN